MKDIFTKKKHPMDSILIISLVSLMITFTLSIPGGKSQISKNVTKNKLLSSFARRLDEVRDVHAFLDEVLVNEEQYYNEMNIPHSPGMISMSSRSGIQLTKGPTSLEEALEPKCVLVTTTVSIAPQSPWVGSRFVPECGRVNRCSGYCNADEKSCQPTGIRNVTFEVFEINSDQSVYSSTSIIEEHLGCSCGCATKPSDCLGRQSFDPEKCTCVCNDYTPMNECERIKKVWYEDTCACECPDYKLKYSCGDKSKIWSEKDCKCICPLESITKCDEGLVYDDNQCTCIRLLQCP